MLACPSRWQRVLREARCCVRDAQVRVRVELCATEGVDVEDVLPFRVSTLAGACGGDDEDDDDGDVCDTDDEDDDNDDEDDVGGDVVGVAFTLLNATVNDTRLGVEERGRAAVLRVMIAVLFVGLTKGVRASTVAQRVAAVGKGEMARALLIRKQRNVGSNDVRIANARFELRLHVALRVLETMPAVAATLRQRVGGGASSIGTGGAVQAGSAHLLESGPSAARRGLGERAASRPAGAHQRARARRCALQPGVSTAGARPRPMPHKSTDAATPKLRASEPLLLLPLMLLLLLLLDPLRRRGPG
jgi:hypothetical protein